MRITLLTLMAAMLVGCGTIDRLGSGVSSPFRGDGLRGAQAEVGGLRFRTRLSVVSEDRRGFATATRGAARAPVSAAEAGRLRATEYCIRRFGGSEIAWDIAPEGFDAAAAVEADGTLRLRGVCLTR
ncbi:hypothetical protein MWU52_15610 [Jannaschia sp. S6380]|uniref:hypothetical protein n=1 Tax=Jannaschia sp. S6380 TaxID=2926408 RepID=UPI001FF19CE9|nr:hypothetical protein [Jannaschia sp. S6380]MCK0168982.1 hypothetical protein [Jannaschia sp. S6380]